jgi:hypothetical protein
MGLLSTKLPFNLMLTQWSNLLNPLLSSPTATPRLLSGVSVVMGKNTINHGLGQKLQGYVVVLNSADATFYDMQSVNASTQKTLILVASAAATISLLVF